jgi:serine/threonine protein kinase
MASDDDNNKTVISTATPSAVEAGTRILGTFEISELIATGGMGEVYRGFNIHTNQSVAIKIVLAALAHDEKIISLFQKEATVLGELHQDAIVRYNIFTIDPSIQRACLVMEFVEGRSMADYIEDGPMPVDDVKTLIRRIAPGLQKAHDLGVVHRDLSPDNVIVQNGDVAQAKIIDFGIAKSESIGGGTLLGGQFAGKYNYVSPEQLGRFKGVVTGQSDIYSLGLVAAAACLGEPLYMGDNPGEAVDRRSDVPDLSGVYDEVRPLLERMLQPDPANRPATMAKVIEMLENPALLYDSAPAPIAPPTSIPPGAAPPQQSAPPGYQPPVAQPPQYGFTTPPSGSYPQGSVPPQPQHPQTNAPYGTAPPAAAPPYVTAPPQQQPPESESPFGPPVTPARPAKGTTVPPHTAAPAAPAKKKGGKGGLIAALVLLLAVGGGAGAYFSGLLGPTGEVEDEQFAGLDADEDIDDNEGSDLPSSPPVDSSQTVNPTGSGDDTTETPPAPETTTSTGDQAPPAPGTDTADDDAPPLPTTVTAGTSTDDSPRVPTDTSTTDGTVVGDVVAALPTPPVEAPTPQIVKSDLVKIGERIEWVKDYPLPTCVHAAILGATTESFAIEGYAISADPFWQLLRDFEAAHGTEPDIGVRLIKSSQCSVIGFLKDMVDSTESSPRLSLDKDVLKSGEPIRGRVELINGRTIWLLLVDAQGGTYDLSSRLRPQEDGTATFALALRPNTLGGADELVPQMIVAVASNAPIANAAAPPGTPSTVLMPLVQTELRNKGTTAAAAVGYFRFDTE